MPRFSAAFTRRKSTADEVQNALINPAEQSSFRVFERTDAANGKSFDGGARLARASGTPMARPRHLDLDQDDNMFANLKGDRGSGASNTSKTTSTDASSRHSNASTAPSSADMATAGAHDDSRNPHKKNLQEMPARRAVGGGTNSFLSKAGRTFSFGQRKANAISPTEEAVPDVPPVPTIQREDENGRARGLTNSTASTTTPPRLENEGIDLGGDFRTMFSGSGFEKRASMATLTNDKMFSGQPQQTPLGLDTANHDDSGHWDGENSNGHFLGSEPLPITGDRPPPVPRHKMSFETRPLARSPEGVDEDAKLLQDSLAATKFLTGGDDFDTSSSSARFKREEGTFKVFPRKNVARDFSPQEDNMFAGTAANISRQSHGFPSRPKFGGQISPNKVMTPAEFEKYRRHKEQLGPYSKDVKTTAANDDDDDDEINYDDDEDEAEKSRQQAKQRRKQEAHMSVYRQQMMKVTGETPGLTPMPSRPSLGTSLSAPHLSLLKSPSPDSAGAADEDEDEEVPLAILQAHGFPQKNRPPTRLSTMGSQSNLRHSAHAAPSSRPGSAHGDPAASPNNGQRHSTLPAFARGLPQDPFVGAGIARPAVRESLAFGGGNPAPPQSTQGTLPPGGLVGVIANEERSRAMRRGSPNTESQKFTPGGPAYDPMAGIPPHMMYGQGAAGGMPGMPQMPGMPGMGQMPPQMLTPGDQAQIQMTQQMQQFMQMQMQFMQMMAANQGAPGQMQQSYMDHGGSQSAVDLSGRQSVMGDFMPEPPRMNPGMRTMSMVQPNTGSSGRHPGYAPSFHSPTPGYTPSIAPSERSNVGLPGRYRPVSQAAGNMPHQHSRANSMSGALTQFDNTGTKSPVSVVSRSGPISDDDDEEGWEAMKAKREKKRSLWRTKKSFGPELNAVI